MDLTPWTDQLAPLVRGRPVVVQREVAAGAGSTCRLVRSLGARDVLVVATSGPGTGEPPSPEEARWVSLDVKPPAGSSTGVAIRTGLDAVRRPPEWLGQLLDELDPERGALVLGSFLGETAEWFGRRFLAHRRPEWLALDDKTTVEELWRVAGIPTAPSAVVPARPDDVCAVWSAMDRGDGVVVSIDAADGWTGGGEGVTWLRSRDDVEQALDAWVAGGRERRVRVMPFLEGIPCSIHGIVLPGGVVVLRPVEMVVLRAPGNRFVYSGCASFWDPSPDGRDVMRDVARRVGAALRDTVAYRGAFTVDGVMTADGFRPTELNPRNGAGLVNMARVHDADAAVQLLLDAAVAGDEVTGRLDWMPERLERVLIEGFDRVRGGGTWRGMPLTPELAGVATHWLGWADSGVLAATAEDDAVLRVDIGPSASGAFLRATPVPGAVPAGAPFGPVAAAVWAWAGEHLGVPGERLVPARDVTRVR